MAVYIGHEECQVIYVARNGQQLRVSSIWVGDQQVFPPANRQEVHLFTRDTQGYGRSDDGTSLAFSVPVPWWATAADVVIIGAGEKGRDGTKSFTGGTDGAGGRSGAWVVKTVALPQATDAIVFVGKGNSTAPEPTGVILQVADTNDAVTVHDGEGTRTSGSGSTGGSVTPSQRAEYGPTHIGGAGGTRNNPGGHPGGGGGGGQGSGLIGNPQTGRNGGDGYVWLRFRSETAIIIGSDGVLRVGVEAGPASEPVHAWAVGIGKTHQTITEITVPLRVVGPSLYALFSDCTSLVSVPDMDTSQVNDMRYMFYNCQSLASAPVLDTSRVIETEAMFSNCWALTSVPDMDTSRVTNMRYMFYDCRALTTVPELNTSRVTNMYAMFQRCSSLTRVHDLDASQATDVYGMFYNCTSLESVTLPGMGNAFTAKQTLDMSTTKLNAAAANALMQSLGTPPPGGTLQLPATAAGADISIATAKNWEVTVG